MALAEKAVLPPYASATTPDRLKIVAEPARAKPVKLPVVPPKPPPTMLPSLVMIRNRPSRYR